MIGLVSLRGLFLAGMTSIAMLFPVTDSGASPPASAVVAGDAAILMGVAVAAPLQSALQQATDRQALKARLNKLINAGMGRFAGESRSDNLARVVRVVFDVGNDGRAANVRVGKRSGNAAADRMASSMIASFKGLPGGERHRVCAVLQYGLAGQDPYEPAFIRALKDATNAAVIDMRAGRDGPDYDRRGRVIIETAA